MCRYAGKTYKAHYVCFRCRKSFKQIDSYDILKRIQKSKIYNDNGKEIKVGAILSKKDSEQFKNLISEIENRIIKCPECSNVMADLGLDFKAPKKAAFKEWKIIEGLYTIGKVFHSCGCSGPGYIPKDFSAYKEYLNKK